MNPAMWNPARVTKKLVKRGQKSVKPQAADASDRNPQGPPQGPPQAPPQGPGRDRPRPEDSALLSGSSFPDGVKVLHDCSDATVDICFVHGLTGDRESTWSPGPPMDSPRLGLRHCFRPSSRMRASSLTATMHIYCENQLPHQIV
jgi:hypothetical protein